MGQMFGAVVALVLLIGTGVSRSTVLATVITTCLSIASRLLFHRRSDGTNELRYAHPAHPARDR